MTDRLNQPDPDFSMNPNDEFQFSGRTRTEVLKDADFSFEKFIELTLTSGGCKSMVSLGNKLSDKAELIAKSTGGDFVNRHTDLQLNYVELTLIQMLFDFGSLMHMAKHCKE